MNVEQQFLKVVKQFNITAELVYGTAWIVAWPEEARALKKALAQAGIKSQFTRQRGYMEYSINFV